MPLNVKSIPKIFLVIFFGFLIVFIFLIFFEKNKKEFDLEKVKDEKVEVNENLVRDDNVKKMEEEKKGFLNCGVEKIKDADGNSYSTIQIGNQCWMGENMRTTKYPDGSSIIKGPVEEGGEDWKIDKGFYSCPPRISGYVPNNSEDCSSVDSLGLLYQWSAAMNSSNFEGAQGICPDGWHIPTDKEWGDLVTELQSIRGKELCQGRTGWQCGSAGSKLAGNVVDQEWKKEPKNPSMLVASDGFGSSGFDAPATGSRIYYNGKYAFRSMNVDFCTSTEESKDKVWRWSISYGRNEVERLATFKSQGYSVRCIKDFIKN
jgi:uncharacterized protein (TIGR02145 family)